METDPHTGISHYINGFDEDFTAFYTADHFQVGTDGEPENQRKVGIVLQVNDLESYEDIPQNIDIQVLVVPLQVTDKLWAQLVESCGHPDVERSPGAVLELAMSYGSYAHVTRFCEGISFGAEPTLADIRGLDDWDIATEWVEKNGATIAQAVVGLIGFALDAPQNRIGETGWDWLMPHMYDDYTSDTLWGSRT